MNNKSLLAKRIPTILGVLILGAGLIAGVLLVGRQQSLTTKAGPTSTPKNVKITNRSSTNVTVSWITDIPVTGFVKYSDDPTKLTLPAGDTRDQIAGSTSQYTTHYVDITGLTPDKTYYLEIGSGPQTYNDNGKPYQVRTSIAGTPPTEDVMSGNVVTAAGAGVSGAIVYVDVNSAETLSALTKSDGTFRLALSNARDKTGNFVAYDKQKDQLSIFVQAGVVGTATAITNTANDNPVPEITIGKTQNFAGGELTPITVSDLTKQSESTPSGFSNLSALTQNSSLTNTPEATFSVKLLNPGTEGESLATNTPEFLGTGPIDLTINLEVGPIASQSGEATVSATGNWAWTAPQKLSYGSHTVILTFLDALGVTQTFSRSFTVLAPGEVGGLPAFTSTPSASPTPTGTPSASPTPTERPSMPSTSGGVPQPGAETPTILLLLIGMSLFWGGIYWKKRMSLY